MFFMTRKRFEDEVMKRVDEWHMRHAMERAMDNLRSDYYRLDERLRKLEGKGMADEKVREVCTYENP